MTNTKVWLRKKFNMKDLAEANNVLGIQIIRAKKNKSTALSQASYMGKILIRFNIENTKKDSYLFDMKSNFLRNNLLRMLKRKKT